MRKMKDSGIEWIGEIPEDWEVGRVKNIAELISGYAFDSEDLNIEGKNIVIRIGDIKDGSVDIENANKTNFNDEVLSFFQVKNNDVLIAMSGATVGKLGYVNFTPKNTYINQRVGILRSSFSKFLYYALTTNKFIEYILLESIGSAQPNISNDGIKNYPLCIPSLPEQQQIADFLDDKVAEIDSVISKTRETIEEYKKLKQSIITEVVTGKVKIENGKVCGNYDTYKDSGIEWIGEIPSEWSVIRTKFISDSMSKGNGITKEQIVQNGDSPCVRYGEIYSKYNHSFSNCITKTNKSMYTNLQYFSYGDILFACTGELPEEIGKNIVYLGNEKCLAGGDIIVLSHSQEPRFLNYVYNSYGQTQKSLGKTKLKVVHISATEIANIFVALPPLSEQQQIVDYLDQKCSEIDALITKKEQLVVELEAYKKSLIYEVVTGKREV